MNPLDERTTLVDVGFNEDTVRSFAQVFVKRTYSISPDAELIQLDEGLPLRSDWRDDPEGLPMGSDQQWRKALVDVVIEGDAISPGEALTDELDVHVQAGSIERHVRVFGNRQAWWSNGKYRMGAPQPFTRMPISCDFAYGGYDVRLFDIEDFVGDPLEVMVKMLFSDARYPRNPWGRGYLCQPGAGTPDGGMPLPNLEDPDDLLTEERLLANPAEWWKQPLPAYLGWMDWRMFPRPRFAGYQGLSSIIDKADELLEVTRGWLGREALEVDHAGMATRYATAFQDAALGMRAEKLEAGAPFSLEGFHPEHTSLQFPAPAAPEVVFRIEGTTQPVPARLLLVVIKPNECLVTFTWHARIDELEQLYVPGLHPIIPVEAQIDGEEPVPYHPPPITKLTQEDFDQ